MSAIRLRTGSRTRPLTEGELTLLAASLFDSMMKWAAAEECEPVAHIAMIPDPLDSGARFPGSLAEFLSKPEADQDYWIRATETLIARACAMMGDTIEPIREQEDRH